MKFKNCKVKIGYREYKIKFVNRVDNSGSVGLCDYVNATIKINKNLRGRELANTISHEINHAILYDRGTNLSDSLDERIVTAFTNGHSDFVIDNPEFSMDLLMATMEDE